MVRVFHGLLAVITLSLVLSVSAQCQNGESQISDLRAALNSDPGDISTRLQLVNVLFLVGSYREAIDVGKPAIEAMPNRSSLYYYVGEGYRKLGIIDSAYFFLQKGYSIHPFADLSEAYAMVLIKMRRVPDATPILDSVALKKANFFSDHIAAGTFAFKSGQLQTAKDEYLAVYVVDKSKLSREQLVFVDFNENFDIYVAQNGSDSVSVVFQRTLKAEFGDKYDFSYLAEACKCMVDQKQIESGRDLFNDLSGMSLDVMSQSVIDAKFFSIAYNLMLHCPNLKDLCETLFRTHVKKQFGLPDTSLASLFALYDFFLTQGAMQFAYELTNKVENTSTPIQAPYLRLAEIFVELNRPPETIQNVRRFFTNAKLDELGYTDEFIRSFQTLVAGNKIDDVKDILVQLGEIKPQELVSTYIGLGEIFTKMGNGDRAISILNKVIALDPGNHAANLKLGEAYFSAGRYDDIIRSLAKTTDKEGLHYLALAYEKKLMLAESNQTWQAFMMKAQDTAQVSEAREHIRQNTITMMNPQFQQMKAQLAAANFPLQLAVTKPSGAVEDNTRGIALITSNNPSVAFEGYASSDSPIDTVMVNGTLVTGITPSPEELSDLKITKQYAVKFATNLMLPKGQKTEVEVLTADAAGNRMTKRYVVDVQAQKAASGSLPTVRAFVVGISQYADKGLTLKYAEDDADLFYQRMRDPTTIGIPASNMTLLTNSAATRAGILDGLEKVLDSSFEGDVIIIYLAMHGVTEEDLLYFVPYDARLTSLRTTGISGLDMDYLVKSKGANRKVIMFVDACHAGGAGSSLVFGGTRGASALPILLEEMAKSQPGIAIFSASDKGQVSHEGDEWGGHGVFTYYLLKAITTPAANTNADQFIQLREIVDYVKNKVSDDTKGKQTPVFKCFGCDPDMPLFYSK